MNTDAIEGLFAGQRVSLAPRDLDRWFTESAVIQDMMKRPQSAPRAICERWPGAVAIDAAVRQFACAGNRIHVEHRDLVTMADGVTVQIDGAGMYLIERGLISFGREYFDRATFYERLAAARGIEAVADDGRAPAAKACAPPGRREDRVDDDEEVGSLAWLVRRFFAAWHAPSAAAMADWWLPAGIFHNVSSASGPPRSGRAAIAEVWQNWAAFSDGVDIEIVASAAKGDVIFVERLDHVRMKTGRMITLPCHGVLRFEHGQIARFADYFDFGWFAAIERSAAPV